MILEYSQVLSTQTNCRVFWMSFNNMKFAWKGTFEALMVKFGGKIGTLYQMLKNAFKKHPLQNRTNVQIKGGGGVKGLFKNVQKNCTFLKWGLPLLSYCLFVWTPMWKFYIKKVEGEEDIFVFKMSAVTSPKYNQKNLAIYINLPLRTQLVFVIYFISILQFSLENWSSRQNCTLFQSCVQKMKISSVWQFLAKF